MIGIGTRLDFEIEFLNKVRGIGADFFFHVENVATRKCVLKLCSTCRFN